MPHHTDTQDNSCGHCYDIHPLQSQYAKVAAFGRHLKRSDAAFGHATSFVVSLVLVLNRVNAVAATTILVLHVDVIGHRVPRQSCFMFLRVPQGSSEVWGAARPPNKEKMVGGGGKHKYFASGEKLCGVG